MREVTEMPDDMESKFTIIGFQTFSSRRLENVRGFHEERNPGQVMELKGEQK